MYLHVCIYKYLYIRIDTLFWFLPFWEDDKRKLYFLCGWKGTSPIELWTYSWNCTSKYWTSHRTLDSCALFARLEVDWLSPRWKLWFLGLLENFLDTFRNTPKIYLFRTTFGEMEKIRNQIYIDVFFRNIKIDPLIYLNRTVTLCYYMLLYTLYQIIQIHGNQPRPVPEILVTFLNFEGIPPGRGRNVFLSVDPSTFHGGFFMVQLQPSWNSWGYRWI